MQWTVAQDLDYFIISSQVLSYKNFNKLQSYFLHCMYPYSWHFQYSENLAVTKWKKENYDQENSD